MSNASPSGFPFRSSFSRAPGGLAPYEVLDVSLEDDTDDLPVSAEKRFAPESDDFGGFFIGLSVAIPAGLAFWAAVVAVLIW